MIRCLLHISSIRAVKYISNPFLIHERPGQRNTFLAVCWLMVLAPSFFPPCILRLAAFCMASKSNPWCNKNRWSSLAITATGKWGEILSNETQWWCMVRLFPSANCSPQRINIRGVKNTGTKRKTTTARMVELKNKAAVHLNSLNIIFFISFHIKLFYNLNATYQSQVYTLSIGAAVLLFRNISSFFHE